MSETMEERTRRRRWLTLAEFVGVAGVIIAALGLYLTWSDRREAAADKAAAARAEARAHGRLELTGTVVENGQAIRLSDPHGELTEVAITLPTALGVPVQHPAEAMIAADAFRRAMLDLTDGGADDRSGRLPVLITASYADGDATRTASAIYDVAWRTHGRRFAGRAFDLTGLYLRQRGGSRVALDAAWAKVKPAR